MLINLIVSIFLFAAARAVDISDLYLTPSSPPTAFLAQYYTLQFRVAGLNNPSFSFIGLPSFLEGSSNGSVQGVPESMGSFSVKVAFSSGEMSGESDVILRVTANLNGEHLYQTSSNFQVLYPNSSLTFLVGNAAKLSLEVQNGKNPYIWSITNLPPGLYADTKGNISGVFLQEGYYTVSVSVSDMTGRSTFNYFGFNVQPKNASKGRRINYAGKLVEVPNRNTNQQQFDLAEIQRRQIQAIKAVFQNAQKVFKAQNQTHACREKVANSTLVMQLAQQQADRFDNRTKDISSIKSLSQLIAVRAQTILNETRNKAELATINYISSKNQSDRSIKKQSQSQGKFDQAALKLNQSTQLFIAARNQSSMAGLNSQLMQSLSEDAHDTYQKAFEVYSFSKKVLQGQLNTLVSANFIVDAARTNLSLAHQANDQVLSSLKAKQSIYEKTDSILESTNKLLQLFRSNQKEAAINLEVSKFDLMQAMNTLFVAQAAKVQADKATAIVSMQTVQNKTVSQLPRDMFSGCDQGAYPMITGTAAIRQRNRYSLKLSSGNILVYGSCSVVDSNLVSGELVTFVGYLREGYVHVQTAKRWRQEVKD